MRKAMKSWMKGKDDKKLEENPSRQESGSFTELKRQPKMQELLKKFSKQNQEQGSFEEWKRRKEQSKKEQSKKEEEITRNNKKRKQEEETQGTPGKRTKSCYSN